VVIMAFVSIVDGVVMLLLRVVDALHVRPASAQDFLRSTDIPFGLESLNAYSRTPSDLSQASTSSSVCCQASCGWYQSKLIMLLVSKSKASFQKHLTKL